MINPLLLFNPFFDLYTGGHRRPTFFDIDVTAPQLRIFDQHYAEVRQELERLLQQRQAIPRYHDIDPWQYKISGVEQSERDWKVFMLYAQGQKPAANRVLCPVTSGLLDGIPGLFQAFFSILEPGKSIPGHCGPYRGYLRYHLGLRVPRENPPAIVVNGQRYVWREGESVLFDDSWFHWVENHASEVRAVLIVDILRPYPALPHFVNLLIFNLIGRLYGKKVMRYFR